MVPAFGSQTSRVTARHLEGDIVRRADSAHALDTVVEIGLSLAMLSASR